MQIEIILIQIHNFFEFVKFWCGSYTQSLQIFKKFSWYLNGNMTQLI